MFSQKFVQTGLKNTRLVKKRYLRANHKFFTNVTLKSCNAQKMSVFGVILVRIQSECRKIKTRITPNTGTFHAVSKGIMARAKPRNYLKKKMVEIDRYFVNKEISVYHCCKKQKRLFCRFK